MSYNSGVIVLVISNHLPDYSSNCTLLSPFKQITQAGRSLIHVWYLINSTEEFPGSRVEKKRKHKIYPIVSLYPLYLLDNFNYLHSFC